MERERSGLGQRVSTSLLAGQIGIHTFQATRYLIAGQVPGPSGNHHPTVAPYGVFDAADGPLVIAVGNEDIWRRFAPLAGLDPPTAGSPPTRCAWAISPSCTTSCNAALARRTVADWLERLRQADVPAGELKTPGPGVRQRTGARGGLGLGGGSPPARPHPAAR